MKTMTGQIVAAIILVAAGTYIGWIAHPKCSVLVDTRSDTTFVRDTTRDIAPSPTDRTTARIDAVALPVIKEPSPVLPPRKAPAAPDDFDSRRDSLMERLRKISRDAARKADSVLVAVPIERTIYETEDYRAEIEGFRARLLSMEIYRQTQIVNTTRTLRVHDIRRWGLGIQAGYGATIRGGKIIGVPYIGIGVSYNLTSW